jgi:cell division protein FtsN
MAARDAESENELVLGNRKIIFIFSVFIVVCGIFFVLGFREGKRQGIQKGAQISMETARKANAVESPARASKPPATDAVAVTPKEDSGQQPVDWHQYVNRKEEPVKDTAKTTTGTAGASKPQKPPDVAQSYSLQAGAFHVKSGAEKEAKALRDKKYDCRIEEPKFAGGLYLVKVGKYKSRAEAVAVQSKLKERNIHADIIKD